MRRDLGRAMARSTIYGEVSKGITFYHRLSRSYRMGAKNACRSGRLRRGRYVISEPILAWDIENLFVVSDVLSDFGILGVK